MSWDYRVVKTKHRAQWIGEHRVKACATWGIHETYYNDKGKPYLVTAFPVEPYGDNLQELQECYQMMAEAFRKPALDFDKIVAKRSGQRK